MTDHAKLSPSGAHRWLHCTASVDEEAKLPDRESGAAAEGTAAHELAEFKLLRRFGRVDADHLEPESKYKNDDMEKHTDDYVDFVCWAFDEAAKISFDAELLVEMRLNLSRWIPGGFGTGDAVIVADDTAHIIDLKYGQGVLVHADENPQLMIYAAGMLDAFDGLYDIHKVKMTVYQPRRGNIDTWETTADAIYEWMLNDVETTAKNIAEGCVEFQAGDWCRFCKLAPTCRARAEAQLKVAKNEFKTPAELDDDELLALFPKMDGLIEWAKAVQHRATELAMERREAPPGYKFVQSRTLRKYVDEQAVAETLAKYGHTDDIYDKKLIGVSKLEKLLGKKQFSEILGDLVIKPEGAPKLVPEGDRRKSVQIKSAKDDFDQVKE